MKWNKGSVCICTSASSVGVSPLQELPIKGHLQEVLQGLTRGTSRSKLPHNDYAVIETRDITEGSYPTVQTGPSRWPSERNGSCKVQASSIYQELLQWKRT